MKRLLLGSALVALSAVASAATAPYVQVVGQVAGFANTCSSSAVPVLANANIDVPAGSSYQTSVFMQVESSMSGMDMGEMSMMMPMPPYMAPGTPGRTYEQGPDPYGGPAPDAYYALLYTSALQKGPAINDNVALSLGTPAQWYSAVPEAGGHTLLLGIVSVYQGANATGNPVATSTITWDCSSGSLVSKTSAGNAAGVAAQLATATAVEFYHPGLDHFFVSAARAEIDALDAGQISGWVRTGATFPVFTDASSGATAVCRIYMPPGSGNSHFYSASPGECATVMAQFPAFVYESAAVFYVDMPDAANGTCAAGSTPVYRLWNHRGDSNHRYTTDSAVKAQMVNRGYVAEGYGPNNVAMCAPN